MTLSKCAFGIIIGTLAAASPAAFAQSEVMVGWQTAASVPGVFTLVWSDIPMLKPAAIEDLQEIRDAIAKLGIDLPAVIVSDNGRSVACTCAKRGDDPTPPAGVTVWPDWKDADSSIGFADVSQVRFISNNHVLLSQHPTGGPYSSYIVDLRQPTTRFRFTGYQLETVRVTDAGKWAALAGDGTLNVGQLDPSGKEGTITANAVPIAGEIRNLIWRKDGRFLLLERTGPLIEVRHAKDWSLVSSIPGGLGPDERSVSPAGRDSCLGYQPGASECVFTVSTSGEITAQQWPHQIAAETGVFVSPLRKFVTTQRRDMNGLVTRECRKTAEATSIDVTPTWSAVPQGTKIQELGWLLWEP